MLSVHETARPAPCPAPFNLAAYVLARAGAQPDKIALQILRPAGAERWSYGRLDAAVRGVAQGLRSMGLAPGDRVLLRLGNSVEFPLAFLGAVAAGLLPVATPAALTAPEVTRIAATLDPALVVAGPGVALPDHPARVIGADDLRAMEDGPAGDFLTGDPDRPGYLVYTSGTSGLARAVVHAHRAVWARRMMWDGWYGLTGSDRVLHAGAFNWTFTLGTGLFDPWAIGATALIPEAGVEPAQLTLFLKRFDATIFAAAPGIYRQMLKSGEQLALPKLRHGLSAGEKLPDATRAAWEAATGRPVYEAFGMSECSTFISASPARPAPPGATGYPQAGRHVALLGSDGRPVPAGEPGQLAVHRDDQGLFLGYYGAEADTAARFAGDWFLTGDRMVMTRDGALTYLGREDDMMNAGGFRVAPAEVEAAFAALPGAGEVAAAELPVGPGKSVIALFHTGPADAAALAAHAAAHLARYKQPRLYRRVDRLPVGGNGKLNRRALREEWEAGY